MKPIQQTVEISRVNYANSYQLVATYWIQRCWLLSKGSIHHNGAIHPSEEVKTLKGPVNEKSQDVFIEEIENQDRNQQHAFLSTDASRNPIHGCDTKIQSKKTPGKVNMTSPMSPRRRRAMERESMIEKVRHMVSSPFPYMVLILLVIMIVMIFVDIMPIAGKEA